MSRSWRKPWIKDTHNTTYNKTIRHRINQIVRTILRKDPEEVELPDPRTIVNDWDITDYRWFDTNNKFKRK